MTLLPIMANARSNRRRPQRYLIEAVLFSDRLLVNDGYVLLTALYGVQ